MKKPWISLVLVLASLLELALLAIAVGPQHWDSRAMAEAAVAKAEGRALSAELEREVQRAKRRMMDFRFATGVALFANAAFIVILIYQRRDRSPIR